MFTILLIIPQGALWYNSPPLSLSPYAGTAQESCDALAYCLLVNAGQLHSYIAMLLEVLRVH